MQFGAFVGLAVALIYMLTTFKYDLLKETLDISFLGVIKMRSIPYGDITVVSRGWKMARINQYLAGRFSMLWNEDVAVTITLKTGMIKNVVISPDDPVAFIEQLNKKISQIPEAGDK